MTREEIQQTLRRIQERLLALGGARGVHLEVIEEDSKFEDEWLYVSVTSPATKVRVSDYADLLSEIEKELRDDQIDNVLLVPTRSTGNRV